MGSVNKLKVGQHGNGPEKIFHAGRLGRLADHFSSRLQLSPGGLATQGFLIQTMNELRLSGAGACEQVLDTSLEDVVQGFAISQFQSFESGRGGGARGNNLI